MFTVNTNGVVRIVILLLILIWSMVGIIEWNSRELLTRESTEKLDRNLTHTIPINCSGGEPFIPKSKEELPNNTAPDIPISFPVDEPDFCSHSSDLEVIAYVVTTLAAIERRNTTRHTWGLAYKHGIKMKVVFMVGKPKNWIEKRILDLESNLYHDIIQGAYTDDYQLVVYKILSSMYWVSSRCSAVPWVIRADDDILVDPFLLNSILPMANKEGFNCYHSKYLNTHRRGKWAVSPAKWSNRTYPPFCTGTFVFHHQQMLHKLLLASCRTPLRVWMEDVHVFGILAEQVGGLKPKLQVMKHKNRPSRIYDDQLGTIVSWVEIDNRIYWWEKIKKFQ